MMQSFAYTSILLVSIYCCLTEAATPSIRWKCDKADEKRMDEMVAKLMTFGRTDVRFPENTDELKTFCKSTMELVGKLEDYKDKCLKGQTKQVVSVAIYSIKNLFNQYCKNRNAKRTKDLVASAKCANAASQGYLKCNNDYTELLMAVTSSKDSKQKLAQLCCGYVEVFKCVSEKTRGVKHCNEEYVEIHKNFVRGIFENSVNVMCGDYNESSDKCDSFKLVRKPLKNSRSRPPSYFSVLIKLLMSL